jgi:hypothetical protein
MIHVSKITKPQAGRHPLHRDTRDISETFALYLGKFQGAVIRCYAEDGETILGEYGGSYEIFRLVFVFLDWFSFFLFFSFYF